MKYLSINEYRDRTKTDFHMNVEEFETAEEALEDAKATWNGMWDIDRKKFTVYAMESVNQDEDAEDHYDGNPFWQDGSFIEGQQIIKI